MPEALVPVTLLTGFFGVGKTTAIRSFLARKPQTENWAILVNEFGEVPIDHTLMEGGTNSGVTVSEIPGGCMCCVKNIPMQVAIREIIQQIKPDRLLIEPTGLGHPAGIFDELERQELKEFIDLGAIICMVDPRFIKDPRVVNAGIFLDQVNIADILIASKSDLSSYENLQNYYKWANTLYPPKIMVGQATMGHLDFEILELSSLKRKVANFEQAHQEENNSSTKVFNQFTNTAAEKGIPVRLENEGHGFKACGWIFSRHDNFLRSALEQFIFPGWDLLEGVERLKGVFRIDHSWYYVDRLKDEVNMEAIAYRRDSRLEVIFPEEKLVNWNNLEDDLIKLLS